MTGRPPEATELSVVIPVRNEERNVPTLIQRLATTLEGMGVSFEVVFVTDENTDRTLDVIREHHARDCRIKALKFTQSFGQHVAVMAGLRAARGTVTVVMDGDLQDCPEDIPKLWERLRAGCDVVYGVKRRKNQSALQNLFSSAFVQVINRLSDRPVLHNTSMFRAMSRRAVDALCRFHEDDPVITGLVSLLGYPTATVEVTSAERSAGETNYNVWRRLGLALRFITAFSTKPLRVISLLGLVVALLSFGYLVTVMVQALLGRVEVMGWPTLVSLMTLLGGVQLLALGVIGEYVGRIFLQAKNRPLYIVEQRIGDLP